MCGRFMLSIVESRLEKLMGADFAVTGLVARYNISPSQPVSPLAFLAESDR